MPVAGRSTQACVCAGTAGSCTTEAAGERNVPMPPQATNKFSSLPNTVLLLTFVAVLDLPFFPCWAVQVQVSAIVVMKEQWLMRLLRSLLAHWLISAGGGNGGGAGWEKTPLRACPPSKCVSKARAKASIAKSRKSLSLLPSHGASSSQPQSTLAGSPPSPATKTNPSTNLHPLCLRQLFPTLIEFILCLGKSSGAPTGRPILFCPNNISLPSPSRTHQPFSHLTDLISHHNELLRSPPE